MATMTEPAMPVRTSATIGAAYTLFLLFLANVLNIADRTLLGIVTDPVKAELGLNDTQMGIVSGIAFVLFNLIGGIFIARWVDRKNRKWILIAGIALWSAATAGSGMAQGFFSLGVSRILVGVGEATAFPVAISMLADLYDAPRRPRAISIFQSSIFVGVVFGAVVAGVLASAMGWRAMFLICGLAGFVLIALILVTMREPERGLQDGETKAPPSDVPMLASLAILARTRGFVALCFGAATASMATAALPTWAPAFLLRSHDVPLAAVGAIIGPAVGLGGVTGTIVAGILATRMIRSRGEDRAALLVPVFALPLAAPALLLFILSPSLPVAMTGAAAMNFLLASAMGPCIATAVAIVPMHVRALSSAVLLVAMGLLGAALSPLIVGVVSDWLQPQMGQDSLRYGLAAMAPTPILAMILLWIAYRQTHKEPQ